MRTWHFQMLGNGSLRHTDLRDFTCRHVLGNVAATSASESFASALALARRDGQNCVGLSTASHLLCHAAAE